MVACRKLQSLLVSEMRAAEKRYFADLGQTFFRQTGTLNAGGLWPNERADGHHPGRSLRYWAPPES